MSATAIVPFAFEDSLFRALSREGEWWFIAGDVAKVLGHRDAEKLTRGLDADEKGTHNVGTLGGTQHVAVISEPGLYRAILHRRASSATSPDIRALIDRFQRWVFHEVLPTLRRTGRYELPGASPLADPDEIPAGALTAKLALVREARILYGRAGARHLWQNLGLPAVPRAEPSPLAAGAAPFDGEAAVTAVRDFLLEGGAGRFPSSLDPDWSQEAVRQAPGFRMAGGDFLFTEAGLAEAIGAMDRKAAADALAEAGFLILGEEGRRKRKERIGGRNARFYRVAGRILDEA